MQNKILCVDSENLLKQSFHGNSNSYSKSYGFIGALTTFYTIIRKVIIEQNITKVILFWDSPTGGKLRHNIYSNYKSNRNKNWNSSEIILSDRDVEREENSDKSLFKQRERIKQYGEELFFRQVEFTDIEADDCIAHFCNELLQNGEEAIIYTNDRDFCQLINEKVSLYLANKKQLITKNTYFLYFDHDLRNSALIKALEGCKTDMIHGVEGLGEKKLLTYFPELRTNEVSFDHILFRAEEINKGRKKPYSALKNLIEGKTIVEIENVYNGRDLFNLNYKLVNLKEPFITEECKEHIEEVTTYPMSDENRGGKNLMKLMIEDGFIHTLPGGADGYVNFLKEFLTVVKREKELYKNYLRSSK